MFAYICSLCKALNQFPDVDGLSEYIGGCYIECQTCKKPSCIPLYCTKSKKDAEGRFLNTFGFAQESGGPHGAERVTCYHCNQTYTIRVSGDELLERVKQMGGKGSVRTIN